MATQESDLSLLKQFVGTRAEITPVSSGETIYGWVKSARQDQILVELSGPLELSTDDNFTIGLSAHNASALFNSAYLGLSGELFVFESPKIVRLGPARMVVRKESSIRTVKLSTGETKITAIVLDIARNGFAVQADISFEQHQKVNAIFLTPDGAKLEVFAETVYCRFHQETQQFRVGFQHQELGRVDHARWQKLLSEEVRDCP